MKIVYARLGVLLLILAAGVFAMPLSKPIDEPCPAQIADFGDGMIQGCAIEVPKPDYVVQWIRIDHVNNTGFVHIQALTVNIGADAAQSSQTKLTATEYNGLDYSVSFDVPPLPHGGYSLHELYYKCSYKVTVHGLADAQGNIDEESETNNGNSASGRCA
jgi:hypothetical protein